MTGLRGGVGSTLVNFMNVVLMRLEQGQTIDLALSLALMALVLI